MPSRREPRSRRVFLNVPFDKSYEPLFVALISALVALGRMPHCVLELPERGRGRLVRIIRLLGSKARSAWRLQAAWLELDGFGREVCCNGGCESGELASLTAG